MVQHSGSLFVVCYSVYVLLCQGDVTREKHVDDFSLTQRLVAATCCKLCNMLPQ